MTEYCYLDVSLFFEEENKAPKLSVDFFKANIMDGVKTLFGEAGAAMPVDILKYNEVSRRAIIRCPASFYMKLRSALSLQGCCFGRVSSYHVYKASSCLLSLMANSRFYHHM